MATRKAKPNTVKNPWNPQDPDWQRSMGKRRSSKTSVEKYHPFRPKKKR